MAVCGFSPEVTIGKKVTIGHGAVIHSKVIGDLAVIGMGAVLSLFSEIGEESIVAEGSTVKMGQVIPPRVVVSGVPARVSKDVTAANRKFWKYGKQLYIDLAKEYLRDGMQRVDFPSSP